MSDYRLWSATLAAVFLLGLPALPISVAAQEADKATVVLWQPGDPGQRLNIRGRVMSTTGQPLADTTVSLWQADGTGSYRDDRYRGQFQTDRDGSFRLATVMPAQYYGAKHIHLILDHPGYRSLRTRILFKGDPYVDEATEGDLAMILEEVRINDETVMVGDVEFVLQSLDNN